MKIVVTGATGYVGQPLVAALIADGHDVVALSRDRGRAAARLPGATIVEANLEDAGPWQASIAGTNAIVHLAGELIAGKRWDARQKQIIRDSRVETTAQIVDAIEAAPAAERPGVLVAASGIDYYPFAPRGKKGSFDLGDDDITEADPPGDSFLARVCRDWEAEALHAESLGVRVVVMRTGLILGPDSAALTKMIAPFKLMLGGRIGSGKQWFSWIHRDDAVAAYRAAITDARYRGPINLVSPEPIRQREVAAALGTALHRPSAIPTPAFAVRLAAGEMAEYILEGRKVVPTVLTELGFTFSRPRIADALRDIS